MAIEAISGIHQVLNKRCTKCRVEKPLAEFNRDSRLPDGRRPSCAECSCRYSREFGRRKRRAAGIRKLNQPDTCQQCSAVFMLVNPRQLHCEACAQVVADKKRLESSRSRTRKPYSEIKAWYDGYRQRNADKLRERARNNSRRPGAKERAAELARERRKQDPQFRLHGRLSSAVRSSLRQRKAGRGWEVLLGYSLLDLVSHIESRFKPGMTWENMSDWEIDHVIPKHVFKFEHENDLEFRRCWALENLQPLWRADNRAKSGKVIS